MPIIAFCRRLAGIILKRILQLINVATGRRIQISIFSSFPLKDVPFSVLVQDYDVIIMKHCFPASDIDEDTGNPDPSSDRKSIENYQAIYRLLRAEFDKHPDTIFMIWTLPPLHRLATNPDSAARATQFSNWLKTEFLTEDGSHPNIYIWDFRDIIMDPSTNCIKYEYEIHHKKPDSHPNRLANNTAGPLFAQFITDVIMDFAGSNDSMQRSKIVFLHHSTGRNVYQYPDLGVPAWITDYNIHNKTEFEISDIWYPSKGNMPVHYYRAWFDD